MRYLVAGMNRSGSTWLYNVVRLLLRGSGAVDVAAGWVDDKDELLGHATPVIKVHIYDPALLVEPYCVLTSHRDLRDVAASLARKFKLPASLEMTRYVFNQYAAWAEHAAYDMRYERMISDPVGEVARVAQALQIQAGGERCAAIAAEIAQATASIQADARGFDPTSLLHEQHITDGRPGSWQGEVSPELAKQIVETFGDWMRQRGYC